jgi:CheY-like chemotaxis protein
MNLRKRSVLLVDDHAILRKSLRTLFDAAGFICSEAKDGAEALDEAGKLATTPICASEEIGGSGRC